MATQSSSATSGGAAGGAGGAGATSGGTNAPGTTTTALGMPQLHPLQEAGVSFLLANAGTEASVASDAAVAVLADARGFGKTLQCLAFLLKCFAREAPSLLAPRVPLVTEQRAVEGSASAAERGSPTGYLALHAPAERLSRVCSVVAEFLRGAWPLSGAPPGAREGELLRRWRTTRGAWSTIGADDVVGYGGFVPVAYACGTTICHAVFLWDLLCSDASPLYAHVRECVLGRRRLRVVALCGGSGAELLSIALFAQALVEAEANDKRNCDEEGSDGRIGGSGGDSPVVEFVVVDHMESWRPSVEAYAARLQDACPGIRLSVTFRVGNLLSREWADSCGDDSGDLAHADVVTLEYGLSELYDRDEAAAARAVQAVCAALPVGALFLVADPVSHQQNEEKSGWLHGLAVESCLGLRFNCPIKSSCHKPFLEGSGVHPWIDHFGMRMGEDVKLSVHVWCAMYTKDVDAKKDPAPAAGVRAPEGILSVLVVVAEGGSAVWSNEVSKASTFKGMGSAAHVPVFVVDGGEINWPRVERTLVQWESRGGILLLTAAQFVRLACSSDSTARTRESSTADASVGRGMERVAEAIFSAHVLVVDEAEAIAPMRYKVGRTRQGVGDTLRRVGAKRRVLICDGGAAIAPATAAAVAPAGNSVAPRQLARTRSQLRDAVAERLKTGGVHEPVTSTTSEMWRTSEVQRRLLRACADHGLAVDGAFMYDFETHPAALVAKRGTRRFGPPPSWKSVTVSATDGSEGRPAGEWYHAQLVEEASRLPGSATSDASSSAAPSLWLPALSGKMEAVFRVLSELWAMGQRVVVLCRRVSTADAIEACATVCVPDRTFRRAEPYKRMHARQKRAQRRLNAAKAGRWDCCIYQASAILDSVRVPTDVRTVLMVDAEAAIDGTTLSDEEALACVAHMGQQHPVRVVRFLQDKDT